MGFLKTIKLDNELVVGSAYGKVTLLETVPNSSKFKVDYYPSRENSKQEQSIIHTRYYLFEPDLNSEQNLFVQAYNYLHTLPEFAEMEDVLEDD